LRFSYNTCPLEYGNKQARFLLNQFSGHRNRAGSPIHYPAAAEVICRAAHRFAARKFAPGLSWYLRTGFPEAFGPAAANRK